MSANLTLNTDGDINANITSTSGKLNLDLTSNLSGSDNAIRTLNLCSNVVYSSST